MSESSRNQQNWPSTGDKLRPGQANRQCGRQAGLAGQWGRRLSSLPTVVAAVETCPLNEIQFFSLRSTDCCMCVSKTRLCVSPRPTGDGRLALRRTYGSSEGVALWQPSFQPHLPPMSKGCTLRLAGEVLRLPTGHSSLGWSGTDGPTNVSF